MSLHVLSVVAQLVLNEVRTKAHGLEADVANYTVHGLGRSGGLGRRRCRGDLGRSDRVGGLGRSNRGIRIGGIGSRRTTGGFRHRRGIDVHGRRPVGGRS